MRALFPLHAEHVEPTAYYGGSRAAREDRPYVVVNMVSSIDGATAVNGVTAELQSPGDKRIFFLLRSLADVILVGAQTVRSEGYGAPRLSDQAVEARLARGQSALPRIAVVTRSLDLDWSSPFFTDATAHPLVLAPTSADPGKVRHARQFAEVLVVGDDRVDLTDGLRALGARGARLVLCEGGPTLNGELARAGLTDELCLTVCPSVVGGTDVARIMGTPLLDRMLRASLLHVLEEDAFLFLRYALAQPVTESPSR